MEKLDLKKGTIYFTLYSTARSPIIFEVKENGSYNMAYYIFNNKNWYNSAGFGHDENAKNNIVLASPSQIKWFNACKEAGKFIPLNEIIDKTHELWI